MEASCTIKLRSFTQKETTYDIHRAGDWLGRTMDADVDMLAKKMSGSLRQPNPVVHNVAME